MTLAAIALSEDDYPSAQDVTSLPQIPHISERRRSWGTSPSVSRHTSLLSGSLAYDTHFVLREVLQLDQYSPNYRVRKSKGSTLTIRRRKNPSSLGALPRSPHHSPNQNPSPPDIMRYPRYPPPRLLVQQNHQPCLLPNPTPRPPSPRTARPPKPDGAPRSSVSSRNAKPLPRAADPVGQ